MLSFQTKQQLLAGIVAMRRGRETRLGKTLSQLTRNVQLLTCRWANHGACAVARISAASHRFIDFSQYAAARAFEEEVWFDGGARTRHRDIVV